jgi:hypothetical protein
MKSHGFGPFEDAFLLMLDKTRQTFLPASRLKTAAFALTVSAQVLISILIES